MTRDSKVVRPAVIPGDGIGPEVVQATVPVLRTALEAERHRLDLTSFDWEGERFLQQGAAMPDDAADLVKKSDAVLFRAVGRPDVPEHELVWGLIIGLRQQLDLAGGMGMAPSANVLPGADVPGIHEPVDGSAPDTAGKGVANPVACMLSGALLLDDLGHAGAARRVRDAVAGTLRDARHHTADLGGNATTADMTSAVPHTMESQGQNT